MIYDEFLNDEDNNNLQVQATTLHVSTPWAPLLLACKQVKNELNPRVNALGRCLVIRAPRARSASKLAEESPLVKVFVKRLIWTTTFPTPRPLPFDDAEKFIPQIKKITDYHERRKLPAKLHYSMKSSIEVVQDERLSRYAWYESTFWLNLD